MPRFDLWVAKQIDEHIRAIGATSFLDVADIAKGDDFEETMIKAAESCDELVVLLTPTALERIYIWIEIGMFLSLRKRIVTVVYGLKSSDLASESRFPVVIKKLQRVDINEIESYFGELSDRAKSSESDND